MSIFHGINASASALTAQRLRMDVTSSNIANAESTRSQQIDGEWVPYRRKIVTMEPNETSFSTYMKKAMGDEDRGDIGQGVRVSRITEDESPFRQVYDPNHPDANGDGYVEMPNVDPLKEMVNMMSATRSYEANVTTMNASKNMLMKALEIGRN